MLFRPFIKTLRNFVSVFAPRTIRFFCCLSLIFPLGCAAAAFSGKFFLAAFSNFQIVNRKICSADEFCEFLLPHLMPKLPKIKGEAQEEALLDLKVFPRLFFVLRFGFNSPGTLIWSVMKPGDNVFRWRRFDGFLEIRIEIVKGFCFDGINKIIPNNTNNWTYRLWTKFDFGSTAKFLNSWATKLPLSSAKVTLQTFFSTLINIVPNGSLIMMEKSVKRLITVN